MDQTKICPHTTENFRHHLFCEYKDGHPGCTCNGESEGKEWGPRMCHAMECYLDTGKRKLASQIKK